MSACICSLFVANPSRIREPSPQPSLFVSESHSEFFPPTHHPPHCPGSSTATGFAPHSPPPLLATLIAWHDMKGRGPMIAPTKKTKTIPTYCHLRRKQNYLSRRYDRGLESLPFRSARFKVRRRAWGPKAFGGVGLFAEGVGKSVTCWVSIGKYNP